MKRIATLAIALILSFAVRADVDSEVVDAVLKITKGVTREDVVKNYDSCDSGITYPMKLCFVYRWMVEDIRMNREYSRALSVAKNLGAEESLRATQRSWIAFRDTECAFQGKMEAGGGSAEGIVVLGCKRAVSAQRADQLAKLVINTQ